MAEPEVPILPPAPNPPPAPEPVTQATAAPAAQASMGGVAASLDRAMASVAEGRKVAESWADEFWDVSGYNKAAVMAAFDDLDNLVSTYNSQYADSVAVLANPGV